MPCPFHAITGLRCPGCGSQRALHALLHGDLSTTFKMNALWILAIPVMGSPDIYWG